MSDNSSLDQQKKCFVVCPIGAEGSDERIHADWLLHEIIEAVFKSYFTNEYKIIRADKISTPGNIDTQVINHILEDDLVIADMSLLNPNVFYEIGIRHMINKPIVHMFKEGNTIPFDVTTMRSISFNYNHPASLSKAREQLAAFVEETHRTDFTVDTPVTRARGYAQLTQIATPTEKILFSEIHKINARLDELNNSQNISASKILHTNEVKVKFRDGTSTDAIKAIKRALFDMPHVKSITANPDEDGFYIIEANSENHITTIVLVLKSRQEVIEIIH